MNIRREGRTGMVTSQVSAWLYPDEKNVDDAVDTGAPRSPISIHFRSDIATAADESTFSGLDEKPEAVYGLRSIQGVESGGHTEAQAISQSPPVTDDQEIAAISIQNAQTDVAMLRQQLEQMQGQMQWEMARMRAEMVELSERREPEPEEGPPLYFQVISGGEGIGSTEN